MKQELITIGAWDNIRQDLQSATVSNARTIHLRMHMHSVRAQFPNQRLRRRCRSAS